jgi:hypothetical protein
MPVKYLAAITVAASSLSAANASEIDSARFVLSGYGDVKYAKPASFRTVVLIAHVSCRYFYLV